MDSVQHDVHHKLPFVAQTEIFAYLVVVVRRDIMQLAFKRGRILSENVVGRDIEQSGKLFEFSDGAACSALIFVIGSACDADSLRHILLGKPLFLTQGT